MEIFDRTYVAGPCQHGRQELFKGFTTILLYSGICDVRLIRWKSGYLTGIRKLDARIRSLVDLLNETALEANTVEHCQDLNDFSEQIVELTEDALTRPGATQGDLDETLQTYQAELDQLLESALPLSARGTPACNDCCMCSHLERRAKAWLGLEFIDRAQCDS